MRRLFGLFGAALSIGCSLSPAVREEDDDIGSSTNWFRVCDTDAQCGRGLACLCGACTKECSSDLDCDEGPSGRCPVDRGAYAAACGIQEALEADRNTCFQRCTESSDCPESRVCVGGGCVLVAVDTCASVERLVLEASSPELRARKGGLFGDQFYVPQWFAGYPQGWVEPYQPSTLTARVTDAAGEPVAGCEVKFFADENSGYGFAESPISNEAGEVMALWVAGSAQRQTLSAAVSASDGWLFASVEGEARGHDEEPQAQGPSARSYTSPSGVGVRHTSSEPSSETRLTFTPMTFPAGVTYSILDTGFISIGYKNDGSLDPEETEVPASERVLELRLFDQAGLRGGVVAIQRGAFCSPDTLGFRCAFPDAWLPGETIQVLLQARHLAAGEAPSDYDPATHATEPCYATAGCSDLSVSTRRSGDEEFVLQAVLRSAGVDDLTTRALHISGIYTPEYGTFPTCLETRRAAFLVHHETRVGEAWERMRGGAAYAFHETWQNQICSNYVALETADGYYLSTGGMSPISTPVLPGTLREL